MFTKRFFANISLDFHVSPDQAVAAYRLCPLARSGRLTADGFGVTIAPHSLLSLRFGKLSEVVACLRTVVERLFITAHFG